MNLDSEQDERTEERSSLQVCPRVAASRFPHGLAFSRGRLVEARNGSELFVAGPVGAATWPRVVFCGLRKLSGAAPGWWGITVVVHDRAREDESEHERERIAASGGGYAQGWRRLGYVRSTSQVIASVSRRGFHMGWYWLPGRRVACAVGL